MPDGAAHLLGGPVVRPEDAGSDQASLIAETSNSSLILSETRTPPVSRAALKLMPQSLRLIVAAPSKPMRGLPKGSWAEPVSSNGTAIDLVMPLIVRSPVIVHWSPPRLTSVEVK